MIFAPTSLLQPWVSRRIVCGALSLLLLLAGCSPESGGNSARGGRRGSGAGGPAPVLVGHAERKVIPIVLDAIGTVEPIRSATVRAQITGTLLKIRIHEGQNVAEGDLLFEIDPRPFENALRSAVADQQRISVQLDTARAQLERYRALPVGSMVSQDQLQQVQDAARALEAQAAAAQAAVASAELQLSFCSIRAPIAGRTGNVNVHEGDLIRANDAGALVTINQISPIYVTFGIPQQQLAAVTRYRSAGTLHIEVAPPAAESRPSVGELTFMDNTVDPSTGTIKLKGTFRNEAHDLWPGQFASVTMTLATPEVLTIPASAIQSDQTGQHVFVIKADQTAEFRPVVVERTYEETAVISRGIANGEVVVTDGQLRVMPGRPVQIRPPETLSNPEAAQAGVESAAGHRPNAKGKVKKEGT